MKPHRSLISKVFDSPYSEFLDKLEKSARKMPQSYEFDPGHADGIRHTDLDAGERVLNEVIQECQHSLEGIKHARLDLESQSWARGQVMTDLSLSFGEGRPGAESQPPDGDFLRSINM